MKIKTIIPLVFLLMITIASLVVAVILFQKNNIDNAMKKTKLADEIVKVIHQRENIIFNYNGRDNNENIILWQVMYAITTNLLQSTAFNTPEEQALLEEMREDNINKYEIFSKLMLLEQNREKHKVLYHQLNEKLRTKLSEYGASIVSGAYRLREINRINTLATTTRANIFIISSVLILITLVVFTLIFLRRVVGVPLLQLNEGMKIVGDGHLDHKVMLHTNIKNEISEMIESFNDMTVKLKTRIAHEKRISKQLAISNKENMYLAQHDLLTGLANKTLTKLFLKNAITASRDTNLKIGVVYLDLDFFKRINDTYGHIKADSLLKEIGKRLKKSVRQQDTVARFGGDEFCVVFFGVKNKEDILKAAEKIKKCISTPFIIEQKEFNFSASIGISIYPDDGEDPDVLIEEADFAMYQAKKAGRNNIQFSSVELSEIEKKKGFMEVALWEALKKNEFILYYQPVIDVKSGKISGLEALIRWKNAEGKIISPDKFIPLAERSDLILLIGDWVLDKAVKKLAEWQPYGLKTMAINISVHQLNHRLIEKTKNIITQMNLPKNSLTFELTETVLMQQTEAMLSFNKALKEIGVNVSIDDFGTGYSSFTYLNKFHISNLKLDISFITNVNQDKKKAAIVKAILQMAHILNIKTIAEGVETKEEFDFLKENNCNECQGYYFSKPLPEDSIIEYLKRMS